MVRPGSDIYRYGDGRFEAGVAGGAASMSRPAEGLIPERLCPRGLG